MKRLLTTLAVGALALFAAAETKAATITISDASPATFSVMCPSGCVGILADGSKSPTASDGVTIGSANEGNIASYLNSIGITTTTADVTKYDLGNGGLGGSGTGSNFSFDVVAGYFFTKYAIYTAFFYTDTAQRITFMKSGGGQGGLSNYGTVAPVPIPAAGFLLLGGLAALGLMRRRAPA